MSSASTGAAPRTDRTPVIVALDGPAGSGKSSVSRRVAERLGYGYLDTGAAYRALAWLALENGVETTDASSVTSLLPGFDYAISLDPAQAWVMVGGTDVSAAIREPAVSAAVSGVARVAAVRARMTDLFRRLVADSGREGVVVEGRDITTVVAPDAAVRILLTADPDVRVARRAVQLRREDTADVAAALHRRDASDAAVVDFLTAAPGVDVIDSSHLDLDQSVAAVLAVIDHSAPAPGRKVPDGQ